MATGIPVYPTGYDTLDTLGAVSGIVPGSGGTHLGDSGPGQGTLLGITKNVLNTILSIENITGFPGTVLSSSHAFRVSALETLIATKVSTTDSRMSPATIGSPGLVPSPPGTTATFLRGDSTFSQVNYLDVFGTPTNPANSGVTTASWNMCPIDGTVSGVTFASTSMFSVGMTLFFATNDSTTASFMEVNQVTDSNHLILRNRGYSNNPPNTTLIPISAVYVACPGIGNTAKPAAGLVPRFPNNSLSFLRADATYSIPVLDALASPTDITTLNASTSAHGLLPKLDNNSAHFLDGTGAWTTPAGGGGGGNPFITTSSSFTVPAINVTVNVTVAATTDMHLAQTHVITDGTLFMIGRVTTIASLVVTYTNQGGGGSVSGSMGAGHVYMSGAMAAIDNTTTHFLSGAGTFLTPGLDTIGAPTDITTLNATSSAHGLLAKTSGTATDFVGGDNACHAHSTIALDTLGSCTDITTRNATSSLHGLLVKVSGTATDFVGGDNACHAHSTIALDTLGVTTDITTLNATSTAHGLLAKTSGTATDFVGGDNACHAHSTIPLDTLGACTDITTRNATSALHGLLVKVSGTATDFVGGDNACHAHSTVALDTLGATTDITTLNSSTSAHGLLKKLDNTSTHFLDGTGAWSTPPSASSTVAGYVPTPPNNTTTFLRGDATFAAPSIKPWKVWNASDAFPAATLYGVWSVVNAIPFLAFNDAATWTSSFMGIVPTGSNLGSGVIVRLKWASATATTGAVIWGAAIERCGNLTVVSDHFDTQVKSTATTAGTVEIFTETAITVTTINSMVAGDAFRLQVQRRGDDVSGNDTMVGDAQLFSVSIEGAA